jgi:hypothetical protein
MKKRSLEKKEELHENNVKEIRKENRCSLMWNPYAANREVSGVQRCPRRRAL